MEQRVTVAIENQVAIVRLNRPQQHNGMDIAMIEALIATAKQLRKNRDIRAVILTGEGPSFCAGIDVKSMFAGGPLKAVLNFVPLLKPTANKYQNVCLIWRTLSVPVIAAIHGSCFGAGIQLALGADVRLASPSAKLSVMEAKWGLIPDMGGMLTLRDHLPRDVAFELTATGRVLTAAEALALGLLTRIEDDPLAAAKAMAAQIATRSPDASAAAKRLFRESWTASDYRVLAAERRWQLRMLLGRNQRIAAARNMGKPDAAYLPRKW
ncbi:MAG: crotonase/enoyl-CoA hydratase family protein [Pseudomonadota bacterium]